MTEQQQPEKSVGIPIMQSRLFESTASKEIVEHVLSKMDDILGDESQPGLLSNSLRNAAYDAMAVFRDILDASICAQAGVYRCVKDPENPSGYLLSGGVELNIKDAEHHSPFAWTDCNRRKPRSRPNSPASKITSTGRRGDSSANAAAIERARGTTKMSNRTHIQASSVGNDAILQRLDHEHLLALRKASRLMEADNEADVGESKETKAAWLAFDPLGYAAASFPATSLEGIGADYDAEPDSEAVSENP
jgi:hypothetical protein